MLGLGIAFHPERLLGVRSPGPPTLSLGNLEPAKHQGKKKGSEISVTCSTVLEMGAKFRNGLLIGDHEDSNCSPKLSHHVQLDL